MTRALLIFGFLVAYPEITLRIYPDERLTNDSEYESMNFNRMVYPLILIVQAV